MPEIQAFRGIRYDLGHVGSLSDVVAPPYDVIDADLQHALYQRHPCNAVRLILNRKEPADDEANNSYTRAARFYRNWQSEGVLFCESDPAIYAYHQEFDCLGQTYTRGGFMARVRLEPLGTGCVFPHEQTMKGPKIDRLMLTTVCQANLSQIFALYPDPDLQMQALLDQAIGGATPIEATDHLGVRHRLWPITNVEMISAASQVMAPKPLFIADGHHRYETACDYREQVAQSGFLAPDHPANFVLMQCVALEDPGLLVLPTHRLFRGLPPIGSEELVARLAPCFTTRVIGVGHELATTAWEDIETGDDQATLGLYTQEDDTWLIAELSAAGRAKMDEVAQDCSENWRSLGVSILHRLVVKTLLGQPDLPKPRFVHQLEEMLPVLRSEEFPLSALVMPATIEHVRQISLGGERMPPKSTYFYPKLLGGMVFNPLQ